MRVTGRSAVLAMCVERGGFRKGRRTAQFIFEWELVLRSERHDVSTEQFAAWWKESNATAYRRLADFRELFPELGEFARPSDLMAPLLAQLASGRKPTADHALVVPT